MVSGCCDVQRAWELRTANSEERRPESFRGFTFPKLRDCRGAFTLPELLIVVGVIGLLMVLIAPAFTTITSGTDVTSAAYTMKGVLDTARTYAKTNNTYTWVGFYEEDVSQSSTNPPTPGVGRVVMSIVASKNGTNVYGVGNGAIAPTQLAQIGKLTKVENVHLPLFAICQSNCTGDTFDTRPAVRMTLAQATTILDLAN